MNPLPYTHRAHLFGEALDPKPNRHSENLPLFRREFCAVCPARSCRAWCTKLEDAWVNAAWQATMDQRRIFGELD